MTQDHPSLTQQITAVELARDYFPTIGKKAHLRAAEIDEIQRQLVAAAETLKHLDFMREAVS